MSSATLSVSRGLQVRAPAPAPASRPTASDAAEEALAQVGEREFRRAVRGRGAVPQPRTEGIAAAIEAAAEVIRHVQWRRAVVVLVVLGLATTAALPVVMHLTRARPPCELHEVRGRLVFGKTVPVGAKITLTPREGGWPYDAFPTAIVGADGWFRVGTFGREDGAPAGTYVATVQWFRVAPDGSVGGNVLPRKYASAASSPLTVSVTGESKTLPELKILR